MFVNSRTENIAKDDDDPLRIRTCIVLIRGVNWWGCVSIAFTLGAFEFVGLAG